MLKLAVIGDPVEHSASPTLHRGFLDAAGIAGTYEAIRIAAGDGARAIDDLRAAGYTGLNVTTPLKEEAFARADACDAIARATGAVNTLVLGTTIYGSNTDGIGTLGALGDAGLAELSGRRVLVLGAGPTARAAIAALVSRAVTTFVWNRTTERAVALAQQLDANVFSSDASPFDAVFSTLAPGAELYDLDLLRAVLAAPIVVDANYAARATLGAFLGRRDVRDGGAMLRASARASFEIFAADANS